MKHLKLILLLLPLLVLVACEKESIEKWECVLGGHLDVTITLTIDSATNLVSVSKSPKKMRDNDQYHQFREEYHYFIQNDTLYCNEYPPHDYAFAITRLSNDKMELKFLGLLPAYHLYIGTYLFNKKQ